MFCSNHSFPPKNNNKCTSIPSSNDKIFNRRFVALLSLKTNSEKLRRDDDIYRSPYSPLFSIEVLEWERTESIATLPPFGPIEGQKWFDQIFSQWESPKNRFAYISFGKSRFKPPTIWNQLFMTTASGPKILNSTGRGLLQYIHYIELERMWQPQTRENINWRWPLSCVHFSHDGIFGPAGGGRGSTPFRFSYPVPLPL